ncbi:hypothetical protein BIW11_07470, partial [Tropilaelaps mercedesae]
PGGEVFQLRAKGVSSRKRNAKARARLGPNAGEPTRSIRGLRELRVESSDTVSS